MDKQELIERALLMAQNLREGEFIYKYDNVIGNKPATAKEHAAAEIIEELLHYL